MDHVQGVALNQPIVPGQSGPACRPEGSRSAASPGALMSTVGSAASFATSFPCAWACTLPTVVLRRVRRERPDRELYRFELESGSA